MKTSENTAVRQHEDEQHEKIDRKLHPEDHLDPLSGEPGAHPVGAGVGAVGGGAAGAAIGSIGGPIGVAVGLVAGAIAGGLAGKEVAEAIDPTDDDAYWRDNFSEHFEVNPDATYETYRPTLHASHEGEPKHPEKNPERDETQVKEFYKEDKGLRDQG